MAFDAASYVYLDYAATAPLCEEAAAAMAPFLAPGRANLAAGGNANSLHGPGRAAFEALEAARRSLATLAPRLMPPMPPLPSAVASCFQYGRTRTVDASEHRLTSRGLGQPHKAGYDRGTAAAKR